MLKDLCALAGLELDEPVFESVSGSSRSRSRLRGAHSVRLQLLHLVSASVSPMAIVEVLKSMKDKKIQDALKSNSAISAPPWARPRDHSEDI
jgi:hypothetical protein